MDAHSLNRAVIMPTGNEILNGLVLDTDSPMVMGILLDMAPACKVLRIAPIEDREALISREIEKQAGQGADLIILIGGSGGGHRHSATLGRDDTHSALSSLLHDQHITSLYGKNRHLWCRLVCGTIGQSLVINLPGPFVEARAAMTAFRSAYLRTFLDLGSINREMAKAVSLQYGAAPGITQET